MYIALKFILFLFSCLPLNILHKIGSILGLIYFYSSKKIRARVIENINIANIQYKNLSLEKLAFKNIQESSKCVLELAIAIFVKPKRIIELFKKIDGWEHIDEAINNKKALILLTPHIGNYDLAGRYIAEKLPYKLTAMYKPHKMESLDKLMRIGRDRSNATIAEANYKGVKKVIKTIKNNEAVMILPDQVPDEGEGIFCNFFNKKAYTMTLAARLANMENTTVLFFSSTRLENSKGFNLSIRPINGIFKNNLDNDVLLINKNIEELIRENPMQYLFSYNRYKIPAKISNKKDNQ